MTLFYGIAAGLIGAALMGISIPLKHSRKIQLMTLMITAPIIIGCYWHWGSLDKWQQFKQKKQEQVRFQRALSQFNNPQQIIAKMKEQLIKSPNSAQGWYLLGKLYLSQSQPKQAISAFIKAGQLKPDDEKIILNLAQSYLLAQQYRRSLDLLNTLKQNGLLTIEVLSLSAMANYQLKNYAQAIRAWRKIAGLLPPDSPDQRVIEQAINKAQHAL